ncbi:MAG TPA: hypothetical protein VNV85_12465, partial [Puia sp.]|nr:hypothetical protein [Puia sp.]
MARKKIKSNIWRTLFFVLIASILTMAAFTGYDWWLERKAHFVRYPEFGVDIPVNYPIHGIDVSKYQN